MNKCRAGHSYDGSQSLACPTCAGESSTRMLLTFVDRAIVNGEKPLRYLDHINVSVTWWKIFLDKQGISKEGAVPALCGVGVMLPDLTKAIRGDKEQDAGKCRGCESRLGELRSAGAAVPLRQP